MDAEAEESFCTAIDIARQQRAKTLELRAIVSLARLWQGQRNRRAARRLLAPAYRWFTEGLETPDLRDARSVLEQLASRAGRAPKLPAA
jgi:predicted ATPase